MPGVPSGRGCEGCRKQKKKCDQARPSCSRCTRLGQACVGAGQQRYKFVEQKELSPDQVDKQISNLVSKSASEASISSVSNAPSNELSMLLSAFIGTFRPSTDLRFNLAWTYGCFIEEIPPRLGRNEALDAAALTLVDAHLIFCTSRKVTPESLIKYSQALRMLRLCLADPVKASSPETLCAVMILLICQSFMKLVDNGWSGHTAGMASIIKARGFYNTQDPFETKLLLAMRGPVVFEALCNSQIQFTASQWKCLAENPLDGDTYEGKLMRCLTMVPYFIENHDKMDTDSRNKIAHEIRTSYSEMKRALRSLKDNLNAIENSIVAENSNSQWGKLRRIHAYLQRGYAIGLTFAIIMNCVLSGIVFDKTELSSDSEHFAEETLLLIDPAKGYYPLAASWIPLCTGMAWIGTTKPWLKSALEVEMESVQNDTGQGQHRMPIDFLEWTSQRLRLEKPDVPYLGN